MRNQDELGNDLQALSATPRASDDPRAVVQRLVDEVMNGGRLEVLDELCTPALTPAARGWIGPFLASFSDVEMRVVETIVEQDRIAARFACSGTHTGTWLGHPPTGRRFTGVSEAYFFRLSGGRIARVWGLEDTVARLRALGLQ
jgi:SnoaL-like polyketide cyclase